MMWQTPATAGSALSLSEAHGWPASSRPPVAGGRRRLPGEYDIVLHLGDAWDRPGGRLDEIAFVPVAHVAAERNLAAVGFDRNIRGVERSRSGKSLFDFLTNVEGLDARLDLMSLVTPTTPISRWISLVPS